MDSRKEIEGWFPNIVGKHFKIVSKDDRDFNCVSFTLDIEDGWMWTNTEIWPYQHVPRNLRIESFKLLYEYYGYKICENDSYEEGYSKIAFYAKDNYPEHASKQFENVWRSRCGKYIIEHELEWLCGNSKYSYGNIAFIMKKKI